MADKRAKAERSKTKDARQMPATDCCPPKKKSKKKKSFAVSYRYGEEFRQDGIYKWLFHRDWVRFGKYRTKEEAEKVVELQSRKRSNMEYRLDI